ncbi:DUF1275 domain-containing protein [Silvanigrella paludirubra]|uniref:DUF1275 domain-containing protein n=1 Tax=Silvanigrella paludirubra TaxID=2499159 RepID=A0A6N6VUR9_9BACT|nr:YoaK family protein [Silvanigrella paludirubra]KAB8040355.1 DUF1275 domain-containing protein [Silvanigrella paludirubra]
MSLHFPTTYTKAMILSFSRKLGLGAVLAFVAGIVNSVGFLGFGQFVSHVSGHATFAAVEYSKHYYLLALTSFSALFFFILGAMSTALLLKGKTIEDFSVYISFPIYIEAILLSYVTLGSFYYTDLQLTYDSYGHANYFFILSFAMGLQNAVLRKKHGSHIRTTHMTGTATDIGVAIGSAIAWGFTSAFNHIKHWIQNKDKLHTREILVDSIKVVYIKSRVEHLFLHVITLTSFGIGAVLGTFGFIKFHFLILLIPIIILFAIGTIELLNHNGKIQNKE